MCKVSIHILIQQRHLAERSLRLGVTKCKVSSGSRSMTGFSLTASLLTVIQFCRAQGRSVLEFLREALASVDEDNLVSLIPTPDFVQPIHLNSYEFGNSCFYPQ